MQLGMIGLGRMGANMVRRLMSVHHEVVGYAQDADDIRALQRGGMTGAVSVADLVAKLAKPRAVWLMIPAAAVDGALASLGPVLDRDDTVIDGGNSYYVDDLRRAQEFERWGIHYVDVGVSGGTWGLERGYCLMIGAAVSHAVSIRWTPRAQHAGRTRLMCQPMIHVAPCLKSGPLMAWAGVTRLGDKFDRSAAANASTRDAVCLIGTMFEATR